MKQLALIFLLLPLSFGFQLENFNHDLSESPALSTDQANALKVHNRARAEVGVEPVEWSSKLAREAQEYADLIAKNNSFEHSPRSSRGGSGENLSWFSYTLNEPLKESSENWYDEIKIYRYQACCGHNFQNTGHYTQMVWNKTTKIGVASAVSANGETYVVARYNPSGNVMGSFPY